MEELQIIKQYRYLNQQETEIRIFSGHGKSVHVNNEKDFLATVKDLNQNEDVYVGVNERYYKGKDDSSIKYVKNVFVDIDTLDEDVNNKFIKALYQNKFKYSFRIESGAGYHYYIPIYPIIIDRDNFSSVEQNRQLFINFKEKFKEFEIDPKVSNLSRVAKVWGTKAHKYDKICRIVEEYSLTEEDLKINSASLMFLPEIKIETQIYEINHECKFMEHYFNTWYPNDMEKNTYIHSNMVAYLKSKFKDNDKLGRSIANKVMILQNHNPSELNSWWNQSMQFSCGAIRNWCKKYRPELEDYCWNCNKNCSQTIKYCADAKSWTHVKKDMFANTKDNKKFIFYINRPTELKGQVTITEYREIRQKITLATIWRKSTDNNQNRELTLNDLLAEETIVQFLDEPKPKKDISEIPVYKHMVDMYIYEFESNDNLGYVLLSEHKIKIGENTIKGMIVGMNDTVEIGNKVNIGSKTQILFVFDTIPSVKELTYVDEMFELTKPYNLTEDKLYNFIFHFPSREKDEEGISFQHPRNFMKFLVATMISSKRSSYPLHLIIIGSKGTGKTYLKKIICELMNEKDSITSSGGNTLKGIIPSHADRKRLELGSLLRANRIVCWDEGLRILSKIKEDESDSSSEKLGDLNDILLHEELNLISGFHRLNGVKMRAKCIMMTNNVRVDDDIFSLYRKVAPSFLDRFMIIMQDKNHVKFIKDEKGKTLNTFNIPKNDWLSIYDFLNNFKVVINDDEVTKIVEKYKNNLEGEILDSFIGRYKQHHLKCLLDGIVKIRCLCERDREFVAKEVDYKQLEELVIYLLNGWFENSNKSILSNVHKKIIDYIGDGISRHSLIEWIKDEQIDEIELKFLRDNNYIELIDNNYRKKIKNNNDLNLHDFDL